MYLEDFLVQSIYKFLREKNIYKLLRVFGNYGIFHIAWGQLMENMSMLNALRILVRCILIITNDTASYLWLFVITIINILWSILDLWGRTVMREFLKTAP